MPMLVDIVLWVFKALYWLLIIDAVMSWVRPDPRNPFVKAVRAVADPLLRPIRAFLPPVGGLDLSPLVAMLILSFLQRILIGALLGPGY